MKTRLLLPFVLILLLALLSGSLAPVAAQEPRGAGRSGAGGEEGEMPSPLASGAGPQTASWTIECVDCPKLFSNMTDRSLRLDHAGHPHVAYGQDHLYYSWHDGAKWHHEVADDAPGVGRYAALALDESDHPHISYYDCGVFYPDPENCARSDLKYAWYDGTAWHIETVDSSPPDR